ncbi:MAG: hypothetical protein ACK5RL_00895 [Acidimicrobiales bacterium]
MIPLFILLFLVGGVAMMVLSIRLVQRVPVAPAWAGPIAPAPAELPGLTAVPWEVESIDRQLTTLGRAGVAGRYDLVATLNRLAGAAECRLVPLPPDANDAHILQAVTVIEQSLGLPPLPSASTFQPGGV